MTIETVMKAASAEILALSELRDLMHDMSFECFGERHTLNGRRLILVNEEGKPVQDGTGGFFAWPNGRRIGKKAKGWPEGHRAEPCGTCWSCKVVSLGIGYLDVYDGRGRREVRL